MKFISLFVFAFLIAGCTANHDIGHEYLGAKYVADPLGEGYGYDADPLIRKDAFDCVTFVETSLANGKLKNLNKIRYKDGDVNFLSRNHFIESDWLENNADLVENVSSKYGDVAVRHVIIDKQNWLRVVHKMDSEFPVREIDLEYIPYEKLGRINTDDALIVLFITGNSNKSGTIGTDLAVVHVGFLLPNGVLRHASSQYGRVMDVDFYEYVAARAKNKNNIGVTLVEIK